MPPTRVISGSVRVAEAVQNAKLLVMSVDMVCVEMLPSWPSHVHATGLAMAYFRVGDVGSPVTSMAHRAFPSPEAWLTPDLWILESGLE